MTRHTAPLTTIINTYAAGPGLIPALTAYVESQMSRAVGTAQEQMAETVCERLHDGRPAGIKCLSCYEAERNIQGTMMVEAEREASRG